ncbi:MAG: hypothetical protein E6Q97_12665 [Desulfurellales bacterium]|nr:MAG: hypothetical protein E6Q97_12665 [Desulfurellales bacterium]
MAKKKIHELDPTTVSAIEAGAGTGFALFGLNLYVGLENNLADAQLDVDNWESYALPLEELESYPGGAAVWGSITGVLSDQTDLQGVIDDLQADIDSRSLSSHTHTFASLTSKPTTLAGYGIADAQPLDSDLTAIAAQGTDAYGRALLTISSTSTLQSLVGVAAIVTGGTTGQVLKKVNSGDGQFDWLDEAVTAWGAITGDITSQTDLHAELTSKQPLDSDLTAIANTGTTEYGRGLLTLPGLEQLQSHLTLTGGTTSQVLTKDSNTNGDYSWQSPSGGTWGSITGTLSSQSDLNSALNGKQPLDADLTAFSGIGSTAYGRGLTTLPGLEQLQSHLTLTGGTTNQVLTKQSNTNGDYSWEDPAGASYTVFPSPRVDEGAYAGGTTYDWNDKVTNAGLDWLSMRTSTGQTPAAGSYFWAREPQTGDVGKPLFRNYLFDDTSQHQTFTHVLCEITSTGSSGTIKVAGPGTELTLSTTLLEDGNSYSIPTKGSFLYWDLSVGDYVSEKPADSDGSARPILFIISINAGASTFLARVL